MFKQRIALFLLSNVCLFGCVPQSSVQGADCPCPSGYMCCESTGQCIPEGDECNDYGIIVDDMSRQGINLFEGYWTIDSDYWARLQTPEIYPDAQAAYEAATKVWEHTETINMASNTSGITFVSEGYVNLGNAKGYSLDGIVEVMGPVDPSAESPIAYGGFVMEFEPRDYSLCGGDECWLPEESGVSRDLSEFKKVVIGLKCDVGAQLILSLSALATPLDAYGYTIECTGEYRDYEIALGDVPPLYGGDGKLDVTDVFRLFIMRNSDGTIEKTKISIIGVALDTSVVNYRDL